MRYVENYIIALIVFNFFNLLKIEWYNNIINDLSVMMEIKQEKKIIEITDYQLVNPFDTYDLEISIEEKKYKCHEQCKGTWCKILKKFRPYPCHFHFIYDGKRFWDEYINLDRDLDYECKSVIFTIKSDKEKYRKMIGANIVPIEPAKGWGKRWYLYNLSFISSR